MFKNYKRAVSATSICQTLKTQTSIVDDVVPLSKTSVEVRGSVKDYTFSSLKKASSEIISTLETNKVGNSKIFLQLGFNGSGDSITMDSTVVSSTFVIELFEALKSRIPSAKNLQVNPKLVSFQMNDIDLSSRTAINVALVLVDHFKEEAKDGVSIEILAGNHIHLAYDFKWLRSEVVNETIINSMRFVEMISFLEKNPHPKVDRFLFRFRDSNKGQVAELNMRYADNLDSQDTLATTEFIRNKLRDKFTHLPIY